MKKPVIKEDLVSLYNTNLQKEIKEYSSILEEQLNECSKEKGKLTGPFARGPEISFTIEAEKYGRATKEWLPHLEVIFKSRGFIVRQGSDDDDIYFELW